MNSSSLRDLVHDHLDRAQRSPAGRSALTLHGGRGAVMRQTLVALTEGRGLDAHDSPGEATLEVLEGRIRFNALTTDDALEASLELAAGDYLVIPRQRHSVDALTDAAILLSVGMAEAATPAATS